MILLVVVEVVDGEALLPKYAKIDGNDHIGTMILTMLGYEGKNEDNLPYLEPSEWMYTNGIAIESIDIVDEKEDQYISLNPWYDKQAWESENFNYQTLKSLPYANIKRIEQSYE